MGCASFKVFNKDRPVLLLGKPELGGSPSSVLVWLETDAVRRETERTGEMRRQVYLGNTLEHKAASGNPAGVSAPPTGILEVLCP